MKNYNYSSTLIAKFIMTVAIIFSWQAVNGLAQMNLPCTPPPAGMVAWYPGDGNALDVQGVNNGTLNNGATFTTTANGKVQEAFSFDGINDSVTFTSDTTGIGTTDFTIDFWIKKTTSRSEGVLGNRPSSCGGGKWFDIRAATTIGIELHEVFPNPYISIGSNRSINDGSFHHVAFTRQANTLSIYIDGILDKSVNIPNINIGSANLLKAGVSGCTGTDGTQFFTGALDEIEVFSRALAAHEIRAIYNSGANGKCKPCAAQPANLVAWYQGDNHAADAVGVNHGTAQNGLSFTPTANGKVREAFNFDGSDDFVEIADSPTLRPAQITLDVWVKPALANVFKTIVTKEPTQFSSGTGYGFRQRDNNKFWFVIGREGFGVTAESTTTLTPGVWYHLTGTYDGAQVKLYVNGFLEDTKNAGAAIDSTAPLRIGRLNSNERNGDPFEGQIDEVQIFNRALDAAETFSIYKAGSAGKCASCQPAATAQVAFYTADGTSEDSQGANEGTMKNGAFYGAGKVDEAFSFDGVDDAVTISDSTDLDLLSSGTIEAWIYLNNTNNGAFIDKGRADNNQASYTWEIYNGDLRFDLYKGDGSIGPGYVTLTTPASNLVGGWNHVAVSWDGSSLRLYRNGGEISSVAYSFVRQDTPYLVGIGTNHIGANPINGRADEIGFYNTALTAAQIQSIYNTGRGGKCRPAPLPSGAVSWWQAEGNANDQISGFNGSPSNIAYTAGRYGQGFQLNGTSSHITIGGLPYPLHPQGSFTIDAWIKTTSNATQMIYAGNGCGGQCINANTSILYFYVNNGSLSAQLREAYNYSGTQLFSHTATNLADGQFHHVALQRDIAANQLRLYVDGVMQGTTLSAAADGEINPALNSADRPYLIGGNEDYPNQINARLNGVIDEVKYFNRALSLAEIQSSGAGVGNTGLSNEISVAVINTTARQNQNFTFTATVTNHGSQSATDVVLNATLPANLNFVSADAGCAYDSSSRRITCQIGTISANFANEGEKQAEQSNEFSPAASVSKQIIVMPTTQGALQTNFMATANEADTVVANNLFSANVNVLAPTAATVSLGGLALTADGRGIRGALITLIKADGSTQTAASGNFGHYSFTNVEAGQTVVLRVSAKRFRFIPNTKIINLIEDIADVNFTAQP